MRMSDFKENVEKLNVRGIVLSSVMTAFGLVVALVWKDTIIATVDYLLPNTDDGTLQGMYISATAVTLLVIVLAINILVSLLRTRNDFSKKLEEKAERRTSVKAASLESVQGVEIYSKDERQTRAKEIIKEQNKEK